MTDSEITFFPAQKLMATIVFWPCNLGDVHSPLYQIESENFLKKNLSLVMYNPPGHGKSPGQFCLSTAARNLAEWLDEADVKDPIIGVGQSGAVAGILDTATRCNFQKIILIAPVWDSRVSLLFMYESGTIHSFINLLTKNITEREALQSALSTPVWLDQKYWEDNYLRDKFSYPVTTPTGSLASVGEFLETFFVRGLNCESELIAANKKCEIIVPKADDWFPIERTQHLAKEHGISCREWPAQSDHYFTGCWRDFWREIFEVYA